MPSEMVRWVGIPNQLVHAMQVTVALGVLRQEGAHKPPAFLARWPNVDFNISHETSFLLPFMLRLSLRKAYGQKKEEREAS